MSDWFADDKTVKVRKRQICEACGHPIDPGETSIYQRGVFYNDFFSRHLHPFCHELWMATADPCDHELGDFHDALFQWLTKHLDHEEASLCFDWSFPGIYY